MVLWRPSLRILPTIVACIQGSLLIGQTSDTSQGVISYKSSQNIYVRFASTDGINTGDTLFVTKGQSLQPAVVVSNVSSLSCIGKLLANVDLQVGDSITAHVTLESEIHEQASQDTELEQNGIITVNEAVEKMVDPPSADLHNRQNIRGRVSTAGHYFYSKDSGRSRLLTRYTLSFSGRHLRNQPFSVETYMIFRQKFRNGEEVTGNFSNAYRVYNFAINYSPSEKYSLTFGRRINSKMANLGAIDGFQAEYKINGLSLGAVVGSRPDNQNYGYNSDLTQYGGYLNFERSKKKYSLDHTVAFIEQRNAGAIDRRYMYIQHSSNLLQKLYLFGSFEADLYENSLSDGAHNTFKPVSTYISLNYRLSSKLSLMASYDARRNVIYFETFKNYLEDLIDRETRQGARFRFNYRPGRNVILGSSIGYRFQKNDEHFSKNLYSFLNIRKVPGINTSMTLSATFLENSYLRGSLYRIQFDKDFFKRITLELYFKYADYSYGKFGTGLQQIISGMDVRLKLAKKLSWSINHEAILEENQWLNRLYTNLIFRF